ncbi:hypothetical protein NHG35_00630 [Aerococcaceae bacterium NML180378]|nr:hypothetical protein [Aerococcaceae bacterium NML180378]
MLHQPIGVHHLCHEDAFGVVADGKNIQSTIHMGEVIPFQNQQIHIQFTNRRGTMIEQQAGLINQLIYQQTVYYGGQHRLYPSITQLFHLLDDIVALGCTTHSISIVPFYRSAARGGFQEELDIGGFYMECRECVTQEEISRFPLELRYWANPDDEYRILAEYISDDDMRHSHFLCQQDDVASFHHAIRTYQTFLMERGIPQMMKWLSRFYQLTPEELAYGYFCFEVRSE